MDATARDELAAALARNRTSGTTCGLAFSGIASRQEAAEVQLAAFDAYGSDQEGYSLAGTNPASQSALGVREPVFGPIASRDFFAGPGTIRLPQGIIGAQCELAFTMGNNYPDRGEAIDRATAANAVVTCRPAIGLLGRRTIGAPHTDIVAIADFGLHVATICGSAIHADWHRLDKIAMTARINGKTVATARGDAILGHPLEAIALLARKLRLQDKQINAGEIVTTGSWSAILQVLPGQTLLVAFETIGEVTCSFE